MSASSDSDSESDFPTTTREEHLTEIEEGMRELRKSVQSFSMQHARDQYTVNPEVCHFLGQVIGQLPSLLETHNIIEARTNLYEWLHRTERNRPLTITEFINPGASIPEPLEGEESDADFEGDIAFEPDVNSFIGNAPFTLCHKNTAYTIEFIPDPVEPQRPVQKRRANASASTKAVVAPASKKTATVKEKAAPKKAAAPKTSKPPTTKTAKPPTAKQKREAAAREAFSRRAAQSRNSPSMSPPPPSPAPTPTVLAKARGKPAAAATPRTTAASKKRGRAEDDGEEESDTRKKIRVTPPPTAGTRKSTRSKGK